VARNQMAGTEGRSRNGAPCGLKKENFPAGAGAFKKMSAHVEPMKPKKSEGTNKISVTLAGDILTAVKLLAKHEERTLSNMISVLLKEALKGRLMPLITEKEWVKRNISIKERTDAALAQVPRFFNLQDFIEKFGALPAWDVNDESVIENELKLEVRDHYSHDANVKPIMPKALFHFNEEIFWLEVPLYAKNK
jgi:hypothetical protein